MMEKGMMNDAERQAMMRSMMEGCISDMSAEDRKELCATMLNKMTEGLDMHEMMPKVMMGMMSGGGEGGTRDMQSKMSGMMQGGHGGRMPQMPEMMLKTMMPHCIGMMLPAIDPDERGGIAAGILSALLEKGASGMTEAQLTSFRESLEEVLHRAA